MFRVGRFNCVFYGVDDVFKMIVSNRFYHQLKAKGNYCTRGLVAWGTDQVREEVALSVLPRSSEIDTVCP